MIPEHILMLAPVAFGQLKQRHQSFAQELAKAGYKVTYVEPLGSGGFKKVICRHSNNLRIVKIILPIRCTAFPKLHALPVKLAMRMVLRQHPLPQESLLWLSEPAMAEFCSLNWQTILYDRCDLHGSFPGQKKMAWNYYENKIISKASLISVSHDFLRTSLATAAQKKCILAANACSDAFLTAPRNPKESTEAPLRLISSGAHFEWIDSAWLQKLVGRPGVELHIAGTGRGKDFTRLISSPGVFFHGQLEHPGLAKLMRTCHVGLLPFKDLELIYGVDPIKAYEYAACGLKIWAPDIAALKGNQLIDQFIATDCDLSRLLNAGDLSTARPRLIALWSDRLKTILDRLTILQ